jgi:3D-(3,5/4)-trihydroxycyclohexane-1,2-dione acylhydrolase (decyclizing)
MAQALIAFLRQQRVERDGEEQPFFAGCLGIFGHGNLAGVGEALQENPQFKYILVRNEQAMVHTAVAYARTKNRLQTLACTTSIGPGATNMVTGAALATINRLPVLLLPGDIFARRDVAPVLQQLESEHSQDISVNDCFKPVSRFWDRINRPEQLITSLPEAMRVLTSPSETGAVTICLPQDVQAEAYDYPDEFFEARVWKIARPRPDEDLVATATEWIKSSAKPLIIAGGGVTYSDANEVLGRLSERTGIPVAETQAGKGSLPWQHRMNVGAIGVTGTQSANVLAREADLIIGVGTRYSDFTTASKSAFRNEGVRFVNINVCGFDSAKHNALPLVGDARVTLQELERLLQSYQAPAHYVERIPGLKGSWDSTRASHCNDTADDATPTQAQVIGALNRFMRPKDVVVCAAGSMPGDLHKLWNTEDPKGYHVEYGYSCMGYEIAGGLGIKMADPEREVYVLVGDGSYLMMSQELITSLQENVKINVILVDNCGYASIGGLSRSLGSEGFGTQYRQRGEDGLLSGVELKIDFRMNAESMGVYALEAKTCGDFQRALETARAQKKTTLIVVPTDRSKTVGGFETWWDVPVAEVSTIDGVKAARQKYEKARELQRSYYRTTRELETQTRGTRKK